MREVAHLRQGVFDGNLFATLSCRLVCLEQLGFAQISDNNLNRGNDNFPQLSLPEDCFTHLGNAVHVRICHVYFENEYTIFATLKERAEHFIFACSS